MNQTVSSFFLSLRFPEDDAVLFASYFKNRQYKKGEFFVKEGSVNRHLALIDTGLLQYFINVDGIEKTTYVTGEKTFAVSLISFLKDVPSKENIRAITDVDCYLLSKADLGLLKQANERFQQFYTSMLEQLIICIDESRFKLIAFTAEQRYLAMMNEEPDLLQQIPLQYLASILGVTPRHLSRIRSEIR